LLPNLAQKAAKVTMLQRSPSYVMGFPSKSSGDTWIRKYLPAWFANNFIRYKFIIMPLLFFKVCRAYPEYGKKIVRQNAEAQLPKSVPIDPTFNPSYGPWEQRLCVCPDGDFFKCLGDGTTEVVTDVIKTVTSNGIDTVSGKTLDADIIVTATGLKLSLAGGAKIRVDGKPVQISEKFFWRSVMLQDVPNATVVIGYTNASWTLGSDTTASMICRLLKYMDKNNFSSAAPRVESEDGMKSAPVLNFSSTYIEKAKGALPRAGDKAPWLPRKDYFTDTWIAKYASLSTMVTGLEFTKVFEAR